VTFGSPAGFATKRAINVISRRTRRQQRHPDVRTALNSLATLYDGHGCYAEGEPLLKRSPDHLPSPPPSISWPCSISCSATCLPHAWWMSDNGWTVTQRSQNRTAQVIRERGR